MVTNISGVLKTYEVYKSEDRQPFHKPVRPDGNVDTVAISDRAMDYQNVRIALQNIPDVREDLVTAVKKKYGANAGAVSDSELIDKIIGKI